MSESPSPQEAGHPPVPTPASEPSTESGEAVSRTSEPPAQSSSAVPQTSEPSAETDGPVSRTSEPSAETDAADASTSASAEEAGGAVAKASDGTVETPISAPSAESSTTPPKVQPRAKIPPRGARLRGRVVGVSDETVLLDVHLPIQAVVPITQFDNGVAPEAGSEFDVMVVRRDPSAGVLQVYRRGALVNGDLRSLMPGMWMEGRVSGMIKGGLELQLDTVRGFMPASQVDIVPMRDISTLLGEQVRCEILEIDRKNKKIIVSRRAVLRQEQEDSRKNLLSELATGQIRKGVVTSLADFGAFVDLGGCRGLLHVSDMRWTPVEKPSDVVQPGDQVEVKVLRVNRERRRISLGLKQITPDPWSSVSDTYPVGKRVKARVLRLAEFGAFAELDDGVTGLIPLSEMCWTHRPAKPQDVVEVGQEVDLVVISVEVKRRRIGLSIKQTTEDPWAGIPEAFKPDSVVTGKVSKLLDFGALVELRAGVEGMVHISEFSENRIRSPGDMVKVGEEVQVKVLGVDPRKRRISLSIKRAKEGDTPTEAPVKRKREKPLRGGLASHFNW